jgi:hypothetical protein
MIFGQNSIREYELNISMKNDSVVTCTVNSPEIYIDLIKAIREWNKRNFFKRIEPTFTINTPEIEITIIISEISIVSLENKSFKKINKQDFSHN